MKQHHEDHKHELFLLTPSLLFFVTCNPRQQLESDLWESKKIRKEKLGSQRKENLGSTRTIRVCGPHDVASRVALCTQLDLACLS